MDPSQCTLCCQWPSEQKDLLDAETRGERRKHSLEYITIKDAQIPSTCLTDAI